MSQLVSVFLRNWVDLAVRCSMLRILVGIVYVAENGVEQATMDVLGKEWR
jgi:hypothetical protein